MYKLCTRLDRAAMHCFPIIGLYPKLRPKMSWYIVFGQSISILGTVSRISDEAVKHPSPWHAWTVSSKVWANWTHTLETID